MTEQQTCGKGLAENSALPEKFGAMIDAVATNLEAHMSTLDLTDERSRAEYDAYLTLSVEHRKVASQLRALGSHMASQRDLPMGAHDMEAMSAPAVRDAFESFVSAEQELLAYLLQRFDDDSVMLGDMGEDTP